jgi:hypothetical protein
MKQTFFLSIFLLIVYTTLSAHNTAVPDSAEITLESDTVNYGAVENNADGNRQLKFTNTGKAPLLISQCTASCGCTVPQWPTNAIAPGETGILNIRYNTSKIGPIKGTIIIYSNAKTPEKEIHLVGYVEFKNAPEMADHTFSKEAKSFSFPIDPATLYIDSTSAEFIAMIELLKQRTKSQKATAIAIESSTSYNPKISYEENYEAPKKRAINTSKLVMSTLRKQGVIFGTYYKEPVILVQGNAKDSKKKKKAKKYQYVKITVD